MSNKKSAKDIAFEKERAKFRQEIRELKRENNDKIATINELMDLIKKKDEEIATKEDWIRRLLEYTELSEEEMKKIILKDKINSEIANRMSGLFESFEPLFQHSDYLNFR